MKGKGAIVVDIDPAKCDAAKKAGAIATIDGSAPDAVAQIQAAAKNGVWSVVDFVGSSATVKLGIDSIIKGGTWSWSDCSAAISRSRRRSFR